LELSPFCGVISLFYIGGDNSNIKKGDNSNIKKGDNSTKREVTPI
jgi:carbonic anhydrase/acetyltransferase-like protein (isoleucine patch superfamily)